MREKYRIKTTIKIPAILFGKKNILPNDLKKPLAIKGKLISYIVELFTSDESNPEYLRDARYKNIVTIENGRDKIGILYILKSLFSINESIKVKLEAIAVKTTLISVGANR
jgi:hypothetical protein